MNKSALRRPKTAGRVVRRRRMSTEESSTEESLRSHTSTDMYDLDCPFAEDYDFDGEFPRTSLCLIVRVCVPSVIGHIRLYTEQK